MSEKNVINQTKNPNTVDSIYKDLLSLNITNGDILLVHSSLSSLGWTCGGPHAVIMGLMKAVGSNGTLVMPSHSGDISDPAMWENPPVPKDWIEKIYESMPAFDVHLSPTRGMGCISELFRSLPDVIRSNHPQVSFSAVGKYAKIITDNHELTPQFGMNSPIGRLYKLNAKVLLLGVGYDSCSSFHLAETLNKKMPKMKMGTAIIENNKRVWRCFEDFAYDSDTDFNQIGNAFDKTDNITIGKVGNANCRIFNIKTGVDFASKWLKQNRFKN